MNVDNGITSLRCEIFIWIAGWKKAGLITTTYINKKQLLLFYYFLMRWKKKEMV